MATNPARVAAAVRRAKRRNEVRKSTGNNLSPAVSQYQQMVYGHQLGQPLPRDPAQFLEGTFAPLTPIDPVPINVPDFDSDDEGRPGPRQRQMPPGWNMPTGVPGSEGFKLASFDTLRMYADIYSVARACIQLRKNEIRGLEWDIMPTVEAERKMRGDVEAHREFAERRAKVVKFFRRPDPDYLSFGSYIDAVVEEMLVTDAISLYLHPTRKSGAGPFGSDLAALEVISGATIRPLVNTRGGRVHAPNPGYQQYLYGVPRVDLMQILSGEAEKEIKELGKPVKEYRGDQLMYLPYTQRAWTPYGFPPLERTLIPTITGLRKQQFQMDFFDEGTIPGNYISPGEQVGWTPNQLQIWQNQQNALAGDPAWKHKSIALPPGSKVFPMKPIPIADQSDEVIMSQVCMGYDVEPMELGVSPKVSATQSSGAANQMAKASQSKQQRKATKPTLSFLTDIFNVVIQVVWQQEDMRFVFEGLEEDEDKNALIEQLVQMINVGLSSIDEARIALGKSPWGLPITSDPVYVSATAGLVPLGSIDPTTGKPMGTPPPQAVGGPPAPGEPGAPPPGVGAGGPPRPALPGGAPAGPGGPSGGSRGPVPTKPGASGATAPGGPVDAFGKPLKPGDPGTDNQHPAPPPKIHPDDKVGQARQAASEAHAGVQQQMHEDYAAGKPLEPPVRPPHASEDTEPTKPPKSTKAMLSELDALRRKTKQGHDPANWQCKNLDPYMVEHFASLADTVGPDDAYHVTRQFLIGCFGPPVVQGYLEKTFDVSTPLDAGDGKQGLAPMSVGDQLVCKECGVSGGRHLGTCSHFDNGATTGQPKNYWSGWKFDRSLAKRYSAELKSGLHSLDVEKLASDWYAQQAGQKGVLSNLAQQVWSWLTAQGYEKQIQDVVARVLTNLWSEGFAVGKESALEQLTPAYQSEFWDSWTPGDTAAARLVAGPGLQSMLDDYGIQTIKSVTKTRMTDLANALAEGFEEGDSADQIAQDIRKILITPQRADMIAGTELARAQTMAAVNEYRAAGQTGKKWSNTHDERVCKEHCRPNGKQGVIPIGQPFEDGSMFTPAHPECRCATLPGMVPAEESGVPSLSLVKGHPRYTPDQVNLRPATSRSRSCVTCAMWTARGHEDDPAAGKCDFGFFADADDTCDKWLAKAANKVGPGGWSLDDEGVTHINIVPARRTTKSAPPGDVVAAGLVVRAKDTGRVLMIQRAHDEDDPAGGMWEFPGGRLDPGETPEEAARREWTEETGLACPAGRVVSTWEQGPYVGHVLAVAHESDVPILDRDKGTNPDDPDNDQPEAVAWWDPAELKNNSAVRDELREHPKRVRRAIEETGDDISKSAANVGAQVYQQLLENYPPDSIAWVKDAEWSGPHRVPWSEIDHDDMDKWAASHEPSKVNEFVEKIKAGKDVNPVVLVVDPDGDYIDVDGHHRALAYHKLNRLIPAWIGDIDSADRHDMEETHLDQVHEGSDKLNKLIVPGLVKDSVGGHHIAGTAYTYHHGWVKIDPTMNDCHDGCGGKTKGGNYLPGHDAKHVSHLHDAVHKNKISPEAALGMLAHAPKLQDKLEGKLAKSGHTVDPFYNSTADYDTHATHTFDPNPTPPKSAKSKVEPGYCKDGCGGKTKGGNYLPGHDSKHVAQLAADVKSGKTDPFDAHAELAHAPKLQAELHDKIGGEKKPLVPGTGNTMYETVEPKKPTHPAPGEAAIPGQLDENQIAHDYGKEVAENLLPTIQNGSPEDVAHELSMNDEDGLNAALSYLDDKFASGGSLTPAEIQLNQHIESYLSYQDPDKELMVTFDPESGEYFDEDGNQVSVGGVLPDDELGDPSDMNMPDEDMEAPTNPSAYQQKTPLIPVPDGFFAMSDGGLVANTTQTPDGRNHSTIVSPNGLESLFAIEANPDSGKTGLRNAALRAVYKGNGKVEVSVRNADGSYGPAGPLANTTISDLSNSPVKTYNLMAERMKVAQDVEKAHQASVAPKPVPVPKPVPKPSPTTAAKPSKTHVPGNHESGPWNAKDSNRKKLHEVMETGKGDGLPTLSAQDSAAHKAHVAQRLAERMTVDHKKMVGAAMLGQDQADIDRWLEFAEHPEKYKYTRGYSGSIHVMPKGAAGLAADQHELTPQAIREIMASKLVQNWAGTSNDASVRSLVAQQAAIDEFNLDPDGIAPWSMVNSLKEQVDQGVIDHGEAYRSFLRAQYELTQEDFAKQGITRVNVIRGMKWNTWEESQTPDWAKGQKTGNVIDMPPMRPMSSWTTDPTTASNFAGSGIPKKITLKASVPASAVLSWPRSGFGCLSEYELVVLAGVGKVTVGPVGAGL